MASSYSTRIRAILQAAGEDLNTWGTNLNTGAIQIIDDAVAGVGNITVSGNVTLTTNNGSVDQARMAILNLTGTGGNLTIPSVSKVYQVVNGTSGNVTVTTGSGASATIAAANNATVVSDGTNVLRFVDAADVAAAQAAAEAYASGLAFSSASGSLPGQAGNSGKFLTTNGTTANWANVGNITGSAASLQTTAYWSATGDAAGTSGGYTGTGNVSIPLTLAASGVSAGSYTYANITVDAKGRVLSASSNSAPTLGSYAVFQEQQSSGTSGQSSSATGAWTRRVINQQIQNTISGASLSSNQITLPAGTYRVECNAQFVLTSFASGQVRAQIHFKNVTDSSTALAGDSVSGPTAIGSNTAGLTAMVSGVFTIAAQKTFQVEYYVPATGSIGTTGSPVSTGEPECFLNCYVYKLA